MEPAPSQEVKVTVDGQAWFWDGGRWVNARTNLFAPDSIVLHLNELSAPVFEELDARIETVDEALDVARIARHAGQVGRAKSLVERVLDGEPRNKPALAILSSILRARGSGAVAAHSRR